MAGAGWRAGAVRIPLGRPAVLFAVPAALLLLLFAALFSDCERWRRLVTVSPAAAAAALSAVAAGDGRRAACDWYLGEWVRDERYPLYKSEECPFLDIGFRCSENGRPDREYEKWRWQPSGCSLPRFDAINMLKMLQNRRVVFVGDSIGRNQWESLLCMLSSAVADKTSIYEVNGNPITKHMGFLVFMFREYNCTVEYYRAPFLVVQSRTPEGVPAFVKTTIKLDVMDWTSERWKDADVLIFNTGHWWNYEKTIRGGSYFQEGDEVKMDMSIHTAYERSLKTLHNWLEREIDGRKTQVIFRTIAPVHFRGEDWRKGSCHKERFPEFGALSIEQWMHFLRPLSQMFLSSNMKAKLLKLDILNITQMTASRKDGHLSVYYLGESVPVPPHRQDCSHWCLPGVPDAWNEILYALILKREATVSRSRLRID